MRALILLIAITCLVIASTSAPARADDITLKDDVERRMVAVRVLDTAMSDVVAYGSGMIVGEKDGEFFITTAKHVVTPANLKADEFAIEVRFFRRDEWVRLKRPPKTSEARDLAVLIAPVKFSPFEPTTLDSTLPIAQVDATSPLKDMTIFGVDVEDKRAIKQRAARLANVDGDKVIFDADDVKPGWSGGITLNEVGLVGMIVSEGSGRQGHQAIAFTTLLDDLKRMDVPMQVRNEPLLAALTNTLQSRLTAALFMWDESGPRQMYGRWAAIKLSTQDGRRYSGMILATQMGGTCVLEARGNAISLELPKQLRWQGMGTFDAAETLLFEPCNDVIVASMIVLRASVAGVTLYLIVPQARTEMLATALIRRSASADWTSCRLDSRTLAGFMLSRPADSMRVQGAQPTLPLLFPRAGDRWSVALAEGHASATLRATLRLTDGASSFNEQKRRWHAALACAIAASGAATESESQRFELDGDRAAKWTAKVPATFDVVFKGERGGSDVPALLEAATLTYD